jgi:hypothetical protein
LPIAEDDLRQTTQNEGADQDRQPDYIPAMSAEG